MNQTSLSYIDLLVALTCTDTRISLYAKRAPSDVRNILSCVGHTDAWRRQLKLVCSLEGHSDWIRALDLSLLTPAGHILLASGSQDNYVRLWRISTGPVQTAEDDDFGLSVKYQSFQPAGSPHLYFVVSESVLLGHESWVTDLRWNRPASPDELPQLASTSADRSLIIWAYSTASSLWLNKSRLGELGGASGLGFYGALWSADSQSVYAHDWAGSVHVWNRKESFWGAGVGISGHTKSVQAIDWQQDGKWLVSTSLDQTTRIHSTWRREEDGDARSTWHEVGRPQTHGHDIYALAILDAAGLRFASGADETIIRLFEAPSNFIERMAHLGCPGLPESSSRPNFAIVPPLGLSNRSVPQGALLPSCFTHVLSGGVDSKEESLYQVPAMRTLSRPPVEEELLSSTLWPE
jgi:elongator complex protein 2